MPERCVALLRGVNLSGHKKVPMAQLKVLVEGLGFTEVSTLLNSGNVVFTCRKPQVGKAAASIQAAILEEMGVSTRVTVLTASELERMLEENPIAGMCDNTSRMLLAVFAEPAARAKAMTLMEKDWAPEVLRIGSRAAYLWCPDGISAGQLGFAMDRALKDGVTARNLGTMTKLRELVRT